MVLFIQFGWILLRPLFLKGSRGGILLGKGCGFLGKPRRGGGFPRETAPRGGDFLGNRAAGGDFMCKSGETMPNHVKSVRYRVKSREILRNPVRAAVLRASPELFMYLLPGGAHIIF